VIAGMVDQRVEIVVNSSPKVAPYELKFVPVTKNGNVMIFMAAMSSGKMIESDLTEKTIQSTG
jgi:hypothetical protein